MSTMQALMWENGKLNLKRVAVPVIRKPMDVKVKVFGTGVCGTDLNVLEGKIVASEGRILGHEAVGTVVEVGKGVEMLAVGDRVAIDPTQFCGKCHNCRSGLTCYCDHFDDWQLGIGANGTFADFYVGEERFMYRIPSSMTWETAVLVEPLSCVLNAIDSCSIKPWDAVLVIGAGPIGALCQMVCSKIARLSVIVESNDSRLQMAAELFEHVCHPKDLTNSKLIELNESRKFDIIFDCVGNQLEYAQRYIERGGRIVPMGFDETVTFTVRPFRYLSNGISLVGTGEVRQIAVNAMRLAAHLPGLERLVTGRYPLHDYAKVFDGLLGIRGNRGGKANMKVVLLSNIGEPVRTGE